MAARGLAPFAFLFSCLVLSSVLCVASFSLARRDGCHQQGQKRCKSVFKRSPLDAWLRLIDTLQGTVDC